MNFFSSERRELRHNARPPQCAHLCRTARSRSDVETRAELSPCAHPSNIVPLPVTLHRVAVRAPRCADFSGRWRSLRRDRPASIDKCLIGVVRWRLHHSKPRCADMSSVSRACACSALRGLRHGELLPRRGGVRFASRFCTARCQGKHIYASAKNACMRRSPRPRRASASLGSRR